jgi:hypothetical protein
MSVQKINIFSSKFFEQQNWGSRYPAQVARAASRWRAAEVKDLMLKTGLLFPKEIEISVGLRSAINKSVSNIATTSVPFEYSLITVSVMGVNLRDPIWTTIRFRLLPDTCARGTVTRPSTNPL